jgi:hypothetical protein
MMLSQADNILSVKDLSKKMGVSAKRNPMAPGNLLSINVR